jgi:hypothetical protein
MLSLVDVEAQIQLLEIFFRLSPLEIRAKKEFIQDIGLGLDFTSITAQHFQKVSECIDKFKRNRAIGFHRLTRRIQKISH